MNRSQLEHIIRAAGTIAVDTELIVFGSQAILGQFPQAPTELLASMEADICPRNHPEKADLVDGTIGEESPFHTTYGYYAHGVSIQIAVLPTGWEQRLVPIKTPDTSGITGWCLDANDLALSKYVAGREKDLRFTEAVATYAYTQQTALLSRLETLPVEDKLRAIIRQRIAKDFSSK